MTTKECQRAALLRLLTPKEACIYCYMQLMRVSATDASKMCAGHLLPPIGPRRPGPIPRPPSGFHGDPPACVTYVVTVCSYIMPSGSEPLGLICAAGQGTCIAVQTNLRKLWQGFCEGDEPDRDKYPNTPPQFWDTYCAYLDALRTKWSEYCTALDF